MPNPNGGFTTLPEPQDRILILPDYWYDKKSSVCKMTNAPGGSWTGSQVRGQGLAAINQRLC
jgi:hypothetical protein